MLSRTIDRVDVHAHFLPESFTEALRSRGITRLYGMPGLPDWSLSEAIETMDQLGVGKAILSISSPGVLLGEVHEACSLARKVNEEAHALQLAHPDRFGHFATLPLPDVEAAITEAKHAMDHLGASGVVMGSNQHGVYLGDPQLEPLYQELNSRKSIIFIHPTSPACSCCPRMAKLYPQPMLEFMFETTRSVVDMLLTGVLQRYPQLRIIVPHAGALIPSLISRIELMVSITGPTDAEPCPSIRNSIKELYFDLAGSPVPHMLQALLDVADPFKILYGSDYPFTPRHICELQMQQLEQTPLLDARLQQQIFCDNPHQLFINGN